MPSFSRLLIANRGEIACRIIRSARKCGIETVAVYSSVDRHAPHVWLADSSVHLGAAPATSSYLNAAAIVDAALQAKADAVHPGYGFLSENASFASRCLSAGLVFVGPSPKAIALMSDKGQAKYIMHKAGVPCLAGFQGEDQSDASLCAHAERLGLPVMVKAVAGGGGLGLYLVSEKSQLAAAIKLARTEAAANFGSSRLMLERVLTGARHVEVQIFGDAHGHTIHMGERDCSVQRRHQKIIAEAPCPVMTADVRAAMGSAAVLAATTVGYCGAGTVEFLLDENGRFYFLEMNTRLQVEHSVTEAITGLDLVALQLKVAAGEPLGLSQADIRPRGCAIEARLYTENPAKGFAPAVGKVQLWHPPDKVRVDAGVATGTEIMPFYDPMVAKITAYGKDREQARQRLIQALGQTALFGVQTNRDFLLHLLRGVNFIAAQATTDFVDTVYDGGHSADAVAVQDIAAAVAIQHSLQAYPTAPMHSKTRLSQQGSVPGERTVNALVRHLSPNNYRITMGDISCTVLVKILDAPTATLGIDGVLREVIFMQDADGVLHLATENRLFTLAKSFA